MIVSIHQPSYWPWFGMLDKIANSDVFVILDNVQLNKDSYQRRNIFFVDGGKKYLTVPIHYNLGVRINEARIRDPEFTRRHQEILKNWYRKAPFFHEINEFIRPIYEKRYETLVDVVNATMIASIGAFGLKSKVVFASDIHVSGTKGELVLNICKALNASTYLSGTGAVEYFQNRDYQSFMDAGIELVFQEFKHPQYIQFNSPEFVPELGCLDFLFNCGLVEAKGVFTRAALKELSGRNGADI